MPRALSTQSMDAHASRTEASSWELPFATERLSKLTADQCIILTRFKHLQSSLIDNQLSGINTSRLAKMESSHQESKCLSRMNKSRLKLSKNRSREFKPSQIRSHNLYSLLLTQHTRTFLYKMIFLKTLTIQEQPDQVSASLRVCQKLQLPPTLKI